MQDVIVFNGEKIKYHASYKNVKNINLRIKHNYIEASLPIGMPITFLEEFIMAKANVIIKRFKQNEKLFIADQYAIGNKLSLLGKEYTIVCQTALQENVYLKDDLIEFVLKTPNTATIKTLFLDLLAKYAKQNIDSAIKNIYPIFKKLGVPMPKIVMRNMTSLWGICKVNSATIVFNNAIGLVCYEGAEYLVAHELAHFLVQNHSQKFYDVLQKVLPDWRNRRNLLKNYCLKNYFKQQKIHT